MEQAVPLQYLSTTRSMEVLSVVKGTHDEHQQCQKGIAKGQ